MTDEEPTASSVPERRLRRRTQALIVVVAAPLLALAGLGATYVQRLPDPEAESAAAELTLEEDLRQVEGVVDVYDDSATSASVFITVTDVSIAEVAVVRAIDVLRERLPDARTLLVALRSGAHTDQGGSLTWSVDDVSAAPERIAADLELWAALAAVDRVSYVSIDAADRRIPSITGLPAYRDDRTIATAAELRTAWEEVLAERSVEATLQVAGP